MGVETISGVTNIGNILGNAKLLASGGLSTDSSWSSGTITAHDLLIIRYSLLNSDAGDMYFTLNNDTAGNYSYTHIDGAVLTVVTGASSIHLFESSATDVTNTGMIIIPGKRNAAETRIGIAMLCGNPSNFDVTLNGGYVGVPAGGITRVDLGVTAGTMTGKIRIYGYNFP